MKRRSTKRKRKQTSRQEKQAAYVRARAHTSPLKGRQERKTTRGLRFPAAPLSPDDVKSLLRACSPRSSIGCRNKGIITVLYRTGARISELLSIYPRDLDASGTLRLLWAKGGKSRVVALDPESMAVVHRWMDRRKELRLDGRFPLFCSLKGKRIHGVYVRNMLRRLAAKAGVTSRCNPHAFRHSLATELAEEGVNICVIQTVLGHESIQTTQKYIHRLHPQAAIDALQQRPWKV